MKTHFSLLTLLCFAICSLAFTPDAQATCNVSIPQLTVDTGCVSIPHAPTASGAVEYMWAQHVNGQIVALTPFSQSTPLTYCPTEDGYYRLCARKVGCSYVEESGDVYVNVCSAEFEHVDIYGESGCDTHDGSITHDPHINSGTVLPYYVSYTYNGRLYTFGPYSTNEDHTIAGLSPGLYEDFTMTDADGCEDNYGDITIDEFTTGCCDQISVDLGEDISICDGSSVTLTADVNGATCEPCENSYSFVLDHFDHNDYCDICDDAFTSTINSYYDDNNLDILDFQDPIAGSNEIVTAITITFNVAAADLDFSNSGETIDNVAYSYPIELNGQVLGYFDPTELPYECNLCEDDATKTVQYTFDPNSMNYVYGGVNVIDLNFVDFGQAQGQMQDVCVANIGVEISTACITPPTPTFVWSDGSTGETLEVTEAGTYSVTVTDCIGCTATDDVTVTTLCTGITGTAPVDMTLSCVDSIPSEDATFESDCALDITFEETNTPSTTCPILYTLTRTWTALDSCGNSLSVVQNITVVDDAAPSIEVAPDAVVECGESFDVVAFSAMDDCSDTQVTIDSTFVADCGNTGVWTITYTATDACGNAASDTQLITIVDTQAPDFTFTPADVLYSCDETPVFESATAQDDCGDVIVTYADYYDYTPWTALTEGDSEVILDSLPDQLSMTSSDTQTGQFFFSFAFTTVKGVDISFDWDYTTEDIASEWDPLFYQAGSNFVYLANDSTAQASGTETVSLNSGETFFIGLFTSDDSFGAASAVISNITIETRELECPVTDCFIRQFVAEDACGNLATYEQFVTQIDTVPPTLTVSASEATLECEEFTCGTDLLEQFYAGQLQGADKQAFRQCVVGLFNDNGLVPSSVTDNCSSGLNFTEDSLNVVYYADCSNGPLASIICYFSATDDCGNVAETVITQLHIQDTTAPELTVAADVTIECGTDVPVASYDVEDSCTDVTVDVTEEITDTCGETFIVTRTYTATDACGNVSSATQTITVVDTIDPVIEAAPDAVVECGESFDVVAFSAMDDCSDTQVTIDSTFVADCGNTGVWTITYTATDACGNTSSDTQLITIVDTQAPDFTFTPADVLYSCDETPVFESATAQDDCGDVSVTYADYYDYTPWTALAEGDSEVILDSLPDQLSMTSSDSQTGQFFFSFAFTTVKGVDISFDWDYTTEDIASEWDPLFYQAGSNFVYLANDTAAQASGSETVSLNSGETFFIGLFTSDDSFGAASAVISNITIETRELECPVTDCFIRQFVAEDACGNLATYEQFVTQIDTIAPTVILDQTSAYLECEEFTCGLDLLEQFYAGQLQGADKQAFRQCVVGLFNDNGLVPSGVLDNCSDGLNFTEDSLSVVFYPDTAGGNIASIICYFSATDDCGNVAETVISQLYISDTTAPVLMANDDVVVECGETVPEAGYTLGDDCSEVSVDTTITSGTICGQTYSVTYTFTATDTYGNFSSDSQTITLVDTTAPQIDSMAVDMNVECGLDAGSTLDAWLATNGGASASDLCGNVTWSNDYCAGDSSVIKLEPTAAWGGFMNVFETPENGGGYVFGSGWGVPDLVTEVDSIQNTLTLRPNRINDLDPFWVNLDGTGNKIMEASTFIGDNSLIGQSFSFQGFVESNDLSADYEHYAFIRIFDADFNLLEEPRSALVSGQGFKVSYNNTQPGAVNIQYGFTVKGRNVNPGGDYDSLYSSLGSVVIGPARCELSDDCGASGEVTVTFTAADDCGNTSSTAATFSISDTTPPVLEVADDAVVECGSDIEFGPYSVSDACGAVSVEIDSTFVSDCGSTGVWTISYTATDDCENSSVAQQTITILDRTAPAFTSVPSDVLYACGDSVDFGMATAEDLCSAVTVSAMDYYDNTPWTAIAEGGSQVILDSLPEQITITSSDLQTGATFYSFAFTTVKGVDISFDWNYDTEDIASEWDPLFYQAGSNFIFLANDNVPQASGSESVSLNAGETFYIGLITTDDSFGAATAVISNITIETRELECPVTECFIRQYVAQDACGNLSFANQVITAVDTIAPVIEVTNEEATLECDEFTCGIDLLEQFYAGQLQGAEKQAFRQCVVGLFGQNGLVPTDVIDNCSSGLNFTEDSLDVVFYNDCSQGPIASIICYFSAMDDCGNVAETVITQLHIQDTTAPVLEVTNEEATLECEEFTCGIDLLEQFYAGQLQGAEKQAFRQCVVGLFGQNGLVPTDVIDNCSSGLNFTEDSLDVVFYDDCSQGPIASIICYFSAMDDCGNVAETVITQLHIQDTTAPVLEVTNEEATLECEEFTCGIDLLEQFYAGQLQGAEKQAFRQCVVGLFGQNGLVPTDVIDNCSSGLNFTEDSLDVVFYDDCSQGPIASIICYFSAMDDCGNVAETVITQLHIQDTTAPVLVMPTDPYVEIGCSAFGCGFQSAVDFVNGDLDSVAKAEFRQCLAGLFGSNGLTPLDVLDNCQEDLTWTEDSLSIDILGECDSTTTGEIVAIATCYFSAVDDCGNVSAVETSQIIISNTQAVFNCDVNETAPVDLTKSFNPVNGVYDRVQVKWYKASPELKYQPEDNAACEIQFLPVRDLATNTPIFGADTSLIGKDKVRKPGQELFKWPIKFNRPDVQPNTRYIWRVRCYCEDGEGDVSPWSDVKVFNTPGFDPATGIYTPAGLPGGDDQADKSLAQWDDNMLLFPNPTEDLVYIQIEGSELEDAVLQVFDMYGKAVLHIEVPQWNKDGQMILDLGELADGNYLITVRSEDKLWRNLVSKH